MIRVKVNILEQLKAKGYSAYKLGRRGDRLLGEAVIQKLRENGLPSWHEMDVICGLLGCQPGDLVEYVNQEE